MPFFMRNPCIKYSELKFEKALRAEYQKVLGSRFSIRESQILQQLYLMKTNLYPIIQLDWQENDRISTLCERIVDYVESNPETVEPITFEQLATVTEGTFTIVELLQATQYLSGERCQLLEYEFVFREEGLTYTYTRQEFTERYQSGDFRHPITGVPMSQSDWKKVVFPVFRVGAAYRSGPSPSNPLSSSAAVAI